MGDGRFRLVDRDFVILDIVYRFRFCLGRHIKVLAPFSGSRSADRRLKILITNGYLERKKYLYGIPYLYSLTNKSRMLLEVNKRPDKIRIDKILHDIYVLDSLIFLLAKYSVTLKDIISEKEANSSVGFKTRSHHPDFLLKLNDEKIAVEIELYPKTKERLSKNIKANYLNYDRQIWIIDKNKVKELIRHFQNEYSNIVIIELEEVINYVRKLNQ